MKHIYIQATGIWLLMAALAVINGVLRNEIYGPRIEELRAHQLSTVSLLLLFTGTLYLWLSRTGASYDDRDLVITGAMFLGITVVFEFVFGHYVAGHPWSRLLRDYDILAGRVWILILLWNLCGPYVIGSTIPGNTRGNTQSAALPAAAGATSECGDGGLVGTGPEPRRGE